MASSCWINSSRLSASSLAEPRELYEGHNAGPGGFEEDLGQLRDVGAGDGREDR